jgi:hypothetical protein
MGYDIHTKVLYVLLKLDFATDQYYKRLELIHNFFLISSTPN